MLAADGYCARHVGDRKIGTFADPLRGSAAARGYDSAWQKLRKQILRRDKGLCQQCLKQGKLRPARMVDHVVPKFECGTDAEENLQAICKNCHDAKTHAESCRAKRRQL